MTKKQDATRKDQYAPERTGHTIGGYLWCEAEGAIHDDDPNPYGLHDGVNPIVCPGPHFKVQRGGEARP